MQIVKISNIIYEKSGTSVYFQKKKNKKKLRIAIFLELQTLHESGLVSACRIVRKIS